MAIGIPHHESSPESRSAPSIITAQMCSEDTVRNHLIEGRQACALSLSLTLPSPVRRLFLSCLFISYHLGSFQLSALALPEPSALPACLPACLPPPHCYYYHSRYSKGYHHYCIIIIMTQILFSRAQFCSHEAQSLWRVCLVGRVHRGPVVIIAASSSTVHGPGWDIAHVQDGKCVRSDGVTH
ncbi:uncharacterized protein K489DRAFT_219984 [Dissoconium aciculare CBS 342.82]|uniref:Uncharacterized protein n=1 Tax=Dissoconium aciculare CBS 342.82 TaxID=1314786 RepID=A0A6J3M4F2_9PEZI|nr:uncharacterized protein K489DRAFT_219984 [Dissoconium aciculare CBS 342.82]KAF1822905.1 hypothetical protein K489DRAFT_219984 [Dissoconium aciculare CBS 342.82]